MMPLSNITSLMFSLVTTVGTNSSDGVSKSVSLPVGLLALQELVGDVGRGLGRRS